MGGGSNSHLGLVFNVMEYTLLQGIALYNRPTQPILTIPAAAASPEIEALKFLLQVFANLQKNECYWAYYYPSTCHSSRCQVSKCA